MNYAIVHSFNGEENVFKGYKACEEFCSFLFTPRHKNYTAIAHNLKGFDGQFILSWLLKQGVKPKIIPNGTKLLMIAVPNLNIRLIDSFSFLPMGLSKLPKTFGMEELKKGFFPHLFNKKENQHYSGNLPDTSYYVPDSMSETSRKEFLTWYDKRKEQPFDFQEEIYSYCK